MQFSDNTKNIFKALGDFRKELTQPKKDADNPQFRSKYVPLEHVVEAIDKVAPKHGLAYFQNVKTGEGDTIGVQTVITHESGEYIIFDWLMMDSRPIIKGGGKGMATSQSQGSAITYARRYSLSSAFGIASEVDDDGNEASGQASENAPYQSQAQPIDKDLEGKKQLLAEKSPVFEKFGISRTSFYAGLGQRLGVPDAIQVPLASLYEVTQGWLKELEDEREKQLETPLKRGELITEFVKLKNEMAKKQGIEIEEMDQWIYKHVGKDNVSHFTNDDLQGLMITLEEMKTENGDTDESKN